MTIISVKPDCSKSSKKKILRDINVAFAQGDAGFIIQQVSEDIHWHIYGDKEIKGKEKFIAEINNMKNYVADEWRIHSIVTHGKEGAVNGEITMGGKVYAFCDVYTFVSAGKNVIREMKSYVIKIR